MIRRSSGDDLRKVSTEFTDVLVCAICGTVGARPIWVDDEVVVAVCGDHDSFWWWDLAIGKARRGVRRAKNMR